MSTPRNELFALVEALNQFSHYMRESWRLQNAMGSGKSPLPQSLQPTPATALTDLQCLVDMDKAYEGDLQDWLARTAQSLKDRVGPLGKWVQEDVTTSLPITWESLLDPINQAIIKAHESVKVGYPDMNFEWEAPGRAAATLQFAARAIYLLAYSVELGRLPEGTRASKRFHPRAPMLEVHVTDSEDVVLGIKDGLEKAVVEAERAIITRRPSHEMTPDEFIATTAVVQVDVGRGKSGTAKTGPERLLFHDARDQETLRNFLMSAYERQSGRAFEKEDLEGRKSWLDNSVRTIMAHAFELPLKVMRVQGGGHLVLSKRPAVDTNILRTIHREYVQSAIYDGLEVPARVLSETEGLNMPEDDSTSLSESNSQERAHRRQGA